MSRLAGRIRRLLGADAGLKTLAKEIATLAQAGDDRHERLVRLLTELDARRSRDAKRLADDVASLQAQMRALLRHRFLSGDATDPALAAERLRFGYYSQHDEDGIVYALLQTIGMSSRYLVDIGCGDFGGNSSWLLQECGYRGLLVDASPTAVSLSRRLFGGSHVEVVRETVSARNVGQLLAVHGVPDDLDLLSIDVDGTDYWIWKAIERRPRLVVIEYNSGFGPDDAVTIPDSDAFVRPAEGPAHLHFGASLAALERLGRQKGYRLVLTDPSGTNAFFVRDDLAAPFARTRVGDHFRMYWKHRAVVEEVGDLAAFLRSKQLPLVDVD